jgi:serine/threonine protein kinase
MKQLGRYRLDTVQGVGAFATVWRGFDEDLDIPVAVKVLADNWAHHADVRERFLEEARLLRRIDDPRVVKVHDVGVADDRPYFVMDFLTGGTVADHARDGLELEQALHLAAEASRGVQALHESGVLHRDVKPSNLLLDSAGRVLVTDLGSAKRLAEASGFTVTTGTPAYMAPEQALGAPLDARCDVYSLGVVAYELVTGRLPFDGTVGRSDRPPATGAGVAVDRLLGTAMSGRPADRPATPGALADALESIGRPGRSALVPVWAVALLMVLGFGAAAVTTWFVA